MAEAAHGNVLVIGAGMAGLAAARRLASRGYQVQVLEGRQRIGGRIWTDRTHGSPIELGASWIESRKLNPVAPLARQWKIPFRRTDFEWVALYDTDGRRFRADRLDQVAAEYERLVLASQARGLPDDVSVAEIVNKRLAAPALSEPTRRIWRWAMAAQACEYGAELEHLSLNHFDEHYELNWDDLWVVGGYDRLVARMAKGLDIRLGQEVQQIEYVGGQVRVDVTGQSYAADCAIVTLPLGVLKAGRVRFSPELPDWKRGAIDRVAMGVVNKLVLHYPRRFWPAEPHFFGYASPTCSELPQIVNHFALAGQNVLTAHFAGDEARRLESFSEQEATDRAQRTLRTMFGAGIPEPTACQLTRWGQDPFSLGSYSYARLCATGSDRDLLAQPLADRLFFAGEATYRRFPGTVHGAYLSGMREAERVQGLAERVQGSRVQSPKSEIAEQPVFLPPS